MTQLIAGDIGGTKTILRLVRCRTVLRTAEKAANSALETVFQKTYRSGDFPDLAPLVQMFWKDCEEALGIVPEPEKACFAIAGPVINNTSSLTNLTWSLSGERLQTELALSQVKLINDFEAVGFGVLGLQASDLYTLQPGQPQLQGPIAVIGAGTGLGQGYLIFDSNHYQVYPSEGGHADFAPRSELEFQLLRYLLDKHQITRVSVERVVSGQGIVSIYQFLRDRHFATGTEEVAEVVATWESQAGQPTKTVDPAAAISQAAIEGQDRLAEMTMEVFVEAYGAEAGNLALKLLPYGGLYLAGGIAAKNLPLMSTERFLQAFVHKGRVSHLLEKVPVHIILNPEVGLLGAALCATRL